MTQAAAGPGAQVVRSTPEGVDSPDWPNGPRRATRSWAGEVKTSSLVSQSDRRGACVGHRAERATRRGHNFRHEREVSA